MTKEGIRLRIRKLLIKLLAENRKKKLKNTEFTIISNNCWGGMVYESFGLAKQSPTVGLFFMAEEYLNFLQKFPDILYKELKFIDPKKSRYVDYLSQDSKFGEYPIALIDGVEIAFLHYQNESEVREKWKRRVNRINFKKIIFKMNDQNMCSEEHLKRFMELPFDNKIIFASKKYDVENLFFIKTAESQESVFASQEPIVSKKYFDIIMYLNKIGN